MENDDVTTASFLDSIENKHMSTSALFVKLRLQDSLWRVVRLEFKLAFTDDVII